MTHSPEELRARLEEIKERARLGLHGASATKYDADNFLWAITHLEAALNEIEATKAKAEKLAAALDKCMKKIDIEFGVCQLTVDASKALAEYRGEKK